MPNSPEKSNRNLLSKEDVFDALYKCCEVNENDEVSLESVLMYISKEIGCKLINSQHIIQELQEKLEERNDNGWMSFGEVCDIFSSWMDEVAERLNQESIKNDIIQFSPELSPMPHKLPSVKRIVLNGLLRDKSDTLEELLLECEKCGREEDCCEWRSNVSNREEKLTRCYEQKVTELQNLLRQSEDCNSLIQLENESLREKCAVFQSKEQNWIATEGDLKENELQLISTNTSLSEQIHAAEKEIQCLKQHLSRLKSENEKLLACNHKLEECVAGKNKIEKILRETRAQLTDLQFDVETKDVALLDIESKFENLLQHNKILQERILELERINNAALPTNEKFEQSISEEMLAEEYLSLEDSVSEYQESCEISTLKDEIEACWRQNPLSCEHVSTQTSFPVESTATQTDDSIQIQFAETIKCVQPEDNLHNKNSHDAHLVDSIENFSKCEVLVKPLNSSNFSECSKVSPDSKCSLVDASVQTIPIQTCDPISQVESVSCNPGVNNSNNVKKRHDDFCSTCDMEIYLLVDSSTQTEGNKPPERKLQSETVKTVARRELTSNNENRFENSCKVVLLAGFASITDHQLRKNTVFKIIRVSRGVFMYKLPTLDYLLVIPRNISYQVSGVSHHMKSGAEVILCKNDLLQDTIDGLCNSVTTVSRNFSQCTAVVNSRWSAKWISTARELVQERPVVHYNWLFLFKLFPLLLLWWMYDEWIQHDDYNWYAESPIWNEIHRILSPMLELRWHNGPPPQ